MNICVIFDWDGTLADTRTFLLTVYQKLFNELGCKINDDFIAWMSYKGPHVMLQRQSKYIGELLHPWWLNTLSITQLEGCITAYNQKNDQLWFYIPGYTTSPYTYGIIFVFDMLSYRQGLGAWYYFKSDKTFVHRCLNRDGHLLFNTAGYLVDFDGGTPDEDVDTLLKMLVLKNSVYGDRARLSMKRLYLDFTSDDTPTARIYMDGSGTPVNLTLNGNKEAFIHYICQTLELEVITSASDNSVEVDQIALEFRPKRF